MVTSLTDVKEVDHSCPVENGDPIDHSLRLAPTLNVCNELCAGSDAVL